MTDSENVTTDPAESTETAQDATTAETDETTAASAETETATEETTMSDTTTISATSQAATTTAEALVDVETLGKDLPGWKLAGLMRHQRWAAGKAVTTAAFNAALAAFEGRPLGGGR